MPRTTFFQRHLGRGGVWILLGAMLFSVALVFLIMRFIGPLPWAGHEYQAQYPARTGTIQWQQTRYEDPEVEKIVGLGGAGAQWDSSRQVQTLACMGLDVETLVMVNGLSQATLPQGWLAQDGMPLPLVVMRAQQALGSMLDELELTQIEKCQQDLPAEPLDMENIQLQQARQVLRETAQRAGLAQLVLSPELLEVENMKRVAGLLDQAGQRLALATGRDSEGLLGLNGRVSLTIMAQDPADPQAGRARAVRMGQQGSPFIEVMVEDNLRVVIHEWFHSLDLGLAPVIIGHGFPGLSWFDQSSRIGPSVRKQELHEKMKRTVAVYSKMKHWQDSQKNQDNARYWTKQGEAMAYAFEFWASENLHQQQCGVGSKRKDPLPELKEAACIAHSMNDYWDELLDELI